MNDLTIDGHLFAFIARLKHLTSLSIHLPGRFFYNMHPAPLAELTHAVPLNVRPGFSTLRSLTLRTLGTTEDDLIQLLTAHGPTLRTLQLDDIHLNHGGSWKVVLPRLRAVCEHLVSAKVTHMFWWNGEISWDQQVLAVEIEQFLLYDTPCQSVGFVDRGKEESVGAYLVEGGICPL